jgi:hypothetical protein
MAFSTGNQFPFAFGAAEHSTNNLANGFAPAGNNNMRFNGAYGTTTIGAPNNGGAYNALPQYIPTGYNGLVQPMFAGTPISQYMRQPVAQYHAAQSLPMATGRYKVPMPYGMRPSKPMAPMVQHPVAGFPTAYSRPNAAMFDGMRSRSHASHSVPLAKSRTVRAMPEQRPAPLVVPANLSNGVAYNALPLPAVAPASVAPAAAPVQLIDLTNDDDEPNAAPSTPGAGTKRARADRTSKSSAKPAKRPRYTAFPLGGALPTPPTSSPVVYTPSAAPAPTLPSTATASDAEVLPATPSPPAQPRVPRKKREDPYNLLGSMHYSFVAKPVNRQLGGSESEKIERPVYNAYRDPSPKRVRRSKKDKKDKKDEKDEKDEKKRSKKRSKTPAMAEEAIEAAASDSGSEPEPAAEIDEAALAAEIEAQMAGDDADVEDDAVFELDDDLEAAVTSAAATPADLGTDAADITSEEAAPIEEETDDSEAIAFDDDGNVITDNKGQPMLLSEWQAKQAAVKQPEEWAFMLEEESTPPAKKSTAAIAKKPASRKQNSAAAEKQSAARKRPTVSGKKLPSKRPAVSGKKIPSKMPSASEEEAELAAALQAEFDADDDDNDNDDDSQPEMVDMIIPMSVIERPAATVTATPEETAENAEDERTLRDLEAKYGEVKDIVIKHEFQAMHERIYEAWIAVDGRPGPLEDMWKDMRDELRETDADDWEISEDES